MAHTIVFHLIRLAKKLQNEVGFKGNGLDLSVSEASALLIIDSQKDTSQIDIALRLHLKPASVVSLIDELEKLNLVTRQTAKSDRRKYQIILTEKGKAEVKKIRSQTNNLEKYIRDVLSLSEVKILYTALEKLSSSLDRLPKNLRAKNLNSREEVKNELPGAKQYVAS